MIPKMILRKQLLKNSGNPRNSEASGLMLGLGVLIIISSLTYMILNLDIADSIIKVWLPIIISGVILVFMSMMVKWQYYKRNYKERFRQ